MFGLFRKKREPEQQIPLAYTNTLPQQEPQHKAFSIALSWKGLFGLLLVFFILQMWMFLLGMWAAQTIVFPAAASALAVQEERQGPEAAAAQQAPSAPATEDQTGSTPAAQ